MSNLHLSSIATAPLIRVGRTPCHIRSDTKKKYYQEKNTEHALALVVVEEEKHLILKLSHRTFQFERYNCPKHTNTSS